MYYKAQHIQILYQVTTETIRTWAQEFGEYLTQTANPGKGRTRIFTQQDMQVFDLIATMRDRSASFEEIHAALQNGSRGARIDMTPEQIMTKGTELKLQLPATKLAQIEVQLQRVQTEYQSLLDQVRPMMEENATLKALLNDREQQIKNIQEAREKDMQSMRAMERELGKLAALLEIAQQKKDDND